MKIERSEMAPTASRPLATCLFAGATAFFALTVAAPVLAQEQCKDYKVVRGDTLSKIAKNADVRGGFQALFNANSDVLSNPNVIEVGQLLKIPCADGALPVDTAAVARAASKPVVTTSQPTRPLRVITGSGYAPFTDEKLKNGGALFEMVERAIEEGNPDQEFNVSFVNDWGSHLDTLLPTGAIDATFPWFRPDCSKLQYLSEASAYRCTQFNHSDPLYEALVGYYTVKGGQYEGAQSYADIKGSRVCRPEAWFTFDLEAEQLMPPNVELVRPVPQNGCWELLMDGKVDIVTLDALPAEEDYRELGLAGQVVHLDSLTSKQTMHVFVDKNNAFANEALPIINDGLNKLRLSGEWFKIVQDGIIETIEN